MKEKKGGDVVSEAKEKGKKKRKGKEKTKREREKHRLSGNHFDFSILVTFDNVGPISNHNFILIVLDSYRKGDGFSKLNQCRFCVLNYT